MEVTYKSPIGNIRITSTSKGISRVYFIEDNTVESIPPTPLLQLCTQQLDEYFNRSRHDFDLPLDWSEATPFELLVWEQLTKIPYGSTITYAELATRLDRGRGAARAVGKAIGDNKIAIIVPCHRVVGKNGSLRGFAWGLERKEALLKLEYSDIFKGQLHLF